MAVKDYLKEIKSGVDEPLPDYSIDYFKDFSEFEVRTLKGQSCHLCGFDLFFGFKMESVKGGPRQKIARKYTLAAKDFIPKGSNKSVLPEIMFKLTRPRNKIVEILMGIPVVEKPKPEPKSKK